MRSVFIDLSKSSLESAGEGGYETSEENINGE